jgi:pimeloyl-ACP methyl ester carboxylesterase
MIITAMAVLAENLVTLRDGRALGYAECGDPDGDPVLHFHGSPSSRLEIAAPEVDRAAAAAGVRLIAPDRPGIGLSDPHPRRTVLDWPVDVVGLAEALGLSRFLAIGVSGGSPYAAACAYRIPHRLKGVGIVSGIAPFDRTTPLEAVGRNDRAALLAGRWFPWLLRRIVRRTEATFRANPEQSIGKLVGRLPESDRLLISNPAHRRRMVGATLEAFRRGSDGVFVELQLASRGWGFQLGEVPMVVNLWFGGQDRTVPPAAGRHLAKSFALSRRRPPLAAVQSLGGSSDGPSEDGSSGGARSGAAPVTTSCIGF